MAGEKTAESGFAKRGLLNRADSEGRARRSGEMGLAEATMGRKGVREAAKEVEGMARGTAAGMGGGRVKRRASEGDMRGIFSTRW